MATDYLIGTKPNQVPTCGDLGSLAFQNADDVVIDNLIVSTKIKISGSIKLDNVNLSDSAIIDCNQETVSLVSGTSSSYNGLVMWPILNAIGTGAFTSYYNITSIPRLKTSLLNNGIHAYYSRLEADGITTTISSFYGNTIGIPQLLNSANVTVTNFYGFNVENPNGITTTNAYGFKTDLTNATNKWGFYNSGGADNYLGSGDTSITGAASSLSFGSDTRQMINLWSTTYGIGVQSSTAYIRTSRNFDIHVGGSHSNTENDPGTGGTLLFNAKYISSTDAGFSMYGSVGINTNYDNTSSLKVQDQFTANGSKYGFWNNTTITDEDLTANRSQYGTYLQMSNCEDGVLLASKVISGITWSAGTATITATAHGYTNGNNLLLSGIAPFCYNGYFTISGVTTNTFNISIAAIVTGSYCATTINSVTVTSTNTGDFRNVTVGMAVSGTGIPANTYVTAVASTTSITISQAATVTGSSLVLTFNPGPYGYSYSTTSSTLNSTTTVTSSALFGRVVAGMTVTGYGIPAGTTVSSVTNTSTIILSQAATVSGTSILSFTLAISGTGIAQKSHGYTQSIYGQQTRAYNSYTFTVGSCVTTGGTNTVTSTNDFTNVVVSGTSFVNTVKVGYYVSGTNIPTNTVVTSVSANSITLSNFCTASGTVTLTFRTSGSIDTLTIISAYFDNDGTVPGGNSITTAYGSLSEVYNSTPLGYMTTAVGDYVKIANTGTGYLTNAYGSYYDTWAASTGSISNLYGSYNRLRCGTGSGQNPTIDIGYGIANSIEQSYGALNVAYGFYNSFTGTIGTKFGFLTLGENYNHHSARLIISPNVTNSVISNCTITSGSAIVTTTGSLTNVYAGQLITGVGIPVNTYVLSKDSSTQLTLSANATSTDLVTLFTTHNLRPVNNNCLLQLQSVYNNDTTIEIAASGSGYNPSIDFKKARGTTVAPTAIQNNDIIAEINAFGYGATAYSSASRAMITLGAAENWTDSAQGTHIIFNTTLSGTTTTSEIARFTNSGTLGIGVSPTNSYGIQLVRNATSAVSCFGISSTSTIQSDVTTSFVNFNSDVTTQASTFTTSAVTHYYVNPSSTFGAGSTVTTQYGFRVSSNTTGAGTNYGFWGNIASGANRYNFYASGTAANYFAGALTIADSTSSTTTTTGALIVTGGIGVGGTVNIGGDVVVTGNVTINGTTTTINATTLTVDDKNIELGSVAVSTDTTANGGGIILKGTSDKSIIWDSTNTNWTSSEHWNLASGKTFKINNVGVLTDTTLGSTVVNSSLTSVGTLTSITTSGSLNLNSVSYTQTITLTTASTSQVALDTWTSATYRSAKYIIQALNTITLAVHTVEVMVIRDNNATPNVYISEYGSVYSSAALMTLTADYSSPNIRLLVTPASANSTQFKVHRILIVA